MELASPEHPLLRELREKAPGTCFLPSEHARGNSRKKPLYAIERRPTTDGAALARPPSRHRQTDQNPTFAIENQHHLSTPHERINPALSRTHHRLGMCAMARIWRTSTACRSPSATLLPSHFDGTSLITYFYHQAIGDGA